MKIAGVLSSWFDTVARSLPRFGAYLWPVSVFGGALGALTLVYTTNEYEMPFQVPGFMADWWFVGFCAVASSLSLAAFFLRKTAWVGRHWLSFIGWASLLCAFRFFVDDQTWLAIPWPESWYMPEAGEWRQVFFFVTGVLDEPLIVAIALFGVVLEGLRRVLAWGDKTGKVFRIGGAWHPVLAGLLALIVTEVVAGVPPYGLVATYFFYDSFAESAYGESESLTYILGTTIDQVVPLVMLFGVYAWKTGAFLSLGADRFQVSLAGGGLTLFTTKWKRVVRLHILSSMNSVNTVVIEHGLLPLYRAHFGVRTGRDGAEAVAGLISAAAKAGCKIVESRLARGSGRVGVLLVAMGLAGIIVMNSVSVSTMERLGDPYGDFVANFAGADHFVLLGSLCAGAALLLGLGFGLMFAWTQGGVRFVPLLLIAIMCGLVPDPLIYWLVYIAIFAILTARLGPIELIPAVPFPDVDIAVFGMWLVGAKALFGVGGYVIGLMIAVRPWYRALPSCPYRLPWAKKRAIDESPVAIDAKLESRAV